MQDEVELVPGHGNRVFESVSGIKIIINANPGVKRDMTQIL
jgi:hypothetical protein